MKLIVVKKDRIQGNPAEKEDKLNSRKIELINRKGKIF